MNSNTSRFIMFCMFSHIITLSLDGKNYPPPSGVSLEESLFPLRTPCDHKSYKKNYFIQVHVFCMNSHITPSLYENKKIPTPSIGIRNRGYRPSKFGRICSVQICVELTVICYVALQFHDNTANIRIGNY